jgi:hypothetical protein
VDIRKDPKLERAPPLVLNIYDKDDDGTNEFIARSIINLSKIEYTKNDTILPPKWYPVFTNFGDSKPSSG